MSCLTSLEIVCELEETEVHPGVRPKEATLRQKQLFPILPSSACVNPLPRWKLKCANEDVHHIRVAHEPSTMWLTRTLPSRQGTEQQANL
jgi:hypothetical protein